jgi:t-SNARE complex subunit (syntaxin)
MIEKEELLIDVEKEKANEWLLLENDMSKLLECVNTLNDIVGYQEISIDKTEQNITDISQNVKESYQEIKKAQEIKNYFTYGLFFYIGSIIGFGIGVVNPAMGIVSSTVGSGLVGIFIDIIRG